MDERAWIRAGQAIAKMRFARGWSQQTLAACAGVATRSVQRVENGSPCSSETLVCLASALDFDARELLPQRPALEVVPVDVGEGGAHGGQVLLPRLETGKALLDLMMHSVSVRLEHENVTGDEVDAVATFFQSVQSWAGVLHELDPGERVRAAARLDARVQQLKEFGLRVYGAIQDRPLVIEPGRSVPRPVAAIHVRHDAPAPQRLRGKSRRKGVGR